MHFYHLTLVALVSQVPDFHESSVFVKFLH